MQIYLQTKSACFQQAAPQQAALVLSSQAVAQQGSPIDQQSSAWDVARREGKFLVGNGFMVASGFPPFHLEFSLFCFIYTDILIVAICSPQSFHPDIMPDFQHFQKVSCQGEFVDFFYLNKTSRP